MHDGQSKVACRPRKGPGSYASIVDNRSKKAPEATAVHDPSEDRLIVRIKIDVSIMHFHNLFCPF